MCGICGIHSGTRSQWLADSVASMNPALDNRGPHHAAEVAGEGFLGLMPRSHVFDRGKGQPGHVMVTGFLIFLNLLRVPPPLTLFEDVLQLPAGHSLLWRNQTATLTRYFHPVYFPDKALS